MDKKVKVSSILISILMLASVSFFVLLRWKQRLEKERLESYYLADSLYVDGKYEEALAKFREVIKRCPEDRFVGPAGREAVSAYYKTGLCLVNLEKYEEAKSVFQKILAEFPESQYREEAYLQLGWVEESQGNLERALAFYEKVVTQFPQGDTLGEALIGSGRVYEKEGKWKESKECLQRVIDDSPEHSNRAKDALGSLNIRLLFSPILTDDSLVYQVKDGDSLHTIAKKYNTTVPLIMRANKLSSFLIHPGKTLKITPGSFHILISKSENKLSLLLNDKLVKVYSVGTGIEDYFTPVGDFQITNKEKEPSWKGLPYGHPENILGTRWMGISSPGYGIHGTTEPETIGKYSSQGCIRMFNKDVEELYDLVTMGTPVTITD